jgi:putative ABC transport system permease protein
VIEGQDLPEHRKLKSAVFAMSMRPRSHGGGRFLDQSDIGKPHIVISTKIARDYPNADGTPKAVGQTVRIGEREFEIVGIYETGSLVLDVTIVMEISVARNLLGVAERMVSTFDVEPVDIAQTDRLADRIEATIAGVQAQRIAQFNLTVGAIMGKLDLFLLMAVALASLVGGVGIANTMLMSTSERYVEFGVMRTNGWTRRNILRLITTESALLGLLSGLLGSAIATATIVIANRFLSDFELDLRPSLPAISMATALLIATLSGLYPAWRASRMTPMDAIRNSSV